MKLYLTEILKEANEFGFGAPGQGGNSADASMSNTGPMIHSPPAIKTNPSAGGMMLPAHSMTNPATLGNGRMQLNSPAFKPTI